MPTIYLSNTDIEQIIIGVIILAFPVILIMILIHRQLYNFGACSIEEMHSAAQDAENGLPSQRPIIEMTIPTVFDKTISPSGTQVCFRTCLCNYLFNNKLLFEFLSELDLNSTIIE